MGAYLNGAEIVVYGNAQDATGDTMNAGSIVIHGSSGDATGYSMRGGEIMIKGNAGYRAGIHMKSYENTCPVMVIGGAAGSFLGEYQAGGHIIVLGLGSEDRAPFGYYCGTGMHGGKMFIRTRHMPKNLPAHVLASPATKDDLAEITPYLTRWCSLFDVALNSLWDVAFYVLSPNTKSPIASFIPDIIITQRRTASRKACRSAFFYANQTSLLLTYAINKHRMK